MQSPTSTSQNDHSLHSPTSSKKQVPTWLPISLLLMTTAALAVPIVLLRRQQSRTLSVSLPPRRIGDTSSVTSRFTPLPNASSSLNESRWPPPRRSGKTPLLGSRLTPGARPNFGLGSSSLVGKIELKERTAENDGFNAPLYTAKAFGAATLIVAVCAATAVWGVKTSMGVKDTQEFADRIRHVILTKLSFLTHRIHRRPPELSSEINSDAECKWSEVEEKLGRAL